MAQRTRRLIGVSLLVGLILFGPGIWHLLDLSFQQYRLERQLAALEARQQALQLEETRLTSDQTYMEGLIRTTFKWAKPGEYVIALEEKDHAR